VRYPAKKSRQGHVVFAVRLTERADEECEEQDGLVGKGRTKPPSTDNGNGMVLEKVDLSLRRTLDDAIGGGGASPGKVVQFLSSAVFHPEQNMCAQQLFVGGGTSRICSSDGP
jgi:hypothetical protein